MTLSRSTCVQRVPSLRMGSYRSLKRIEVTEVQSAEYSQILRINNAATPNVNDLSMEDWRTLVQTAVRLRAARVEGEIAGFLLALDQNADYDSPNFRWFKERYDRFVYIDRVVVAEGMRGVGVGRVLYADIQSFAEARAPFLTCEVNLRPRNQNSLLFHQATGFHEVGEAEGNQDKRVVFLAKPLAAFDFVRRTYGAELT